MGEAFLVGSDPGGRRRERNILRAMALPFSLRALR